MIGEVDVGEPWQHTHRTIVTPRTRTSLLRVNRLFFEVFIRTASEQGLTRSKGDVQAFGLEWDSTRPPSASDGTPTNRVTCGCRPQPMDHDTEPTDSSGFIANGGANPSLDHRAAVGWNTGDPNLQGAAPSLRSMSATSRSNSGSPSGVRDVDPVVLRQYRVRAQIEPNSVDVRAAAGHATGYVRRVPGRPSAPISSVRASRTFARDSGLAPSAERAGPGRWTLPPV